MKTYEENIVGNKRIVFVCLHRGKDIFELKYELDTKTWYLLKIRCKEFVRFELL